MTKIPHQDERYRDSGRRLIQIGGKPVHAAKAKLRAEDIEANPSCTHQIVYRVTPGAVARVGMVVAFEETAFLVRAIADPYAGDELMKRKFVKLIVRAV